MHTFNGHSLAKSTQQPPSYKVFELKEKVLLTAFDNRRPAPTLYPLASKSPKTYKGE